MRHIVGHADARQKRGTPGPIRQAVIFEDALHRVRLGRRNPTRVARCNKRRVVRNDMAILSQSSQNFLVRQTHRRHHLFEAWGNLSWGHGWLIVSR